MARAVSAAVLWAAVIAWARAPEVRASEVAPASRSADALAEPLWTEIATMAAEATTAAARSARVRLREVRDEDVGVTRTPSNAVGG